MERREEGGEVRMREQEGETGGMGGGEGGEVSEQVNTICRMSTRTCQQ